MSYPNNVRAYREYHGVSQRWLARKATGCTHELERRNNHDKQHDGRGTESVYAA